MKRHRAEVLIVGAGAAGLAAGRRLKEADRTCVLLEARNRIGGRVLTIRHRKSKQPLEAGAEFVHGEPEESTAILRQSGLDIVPVPDLHWEETATGVKPAPKMDSWEEIARRMRFPRDIDESFADFLRRDCADLSVETRTQATRYVEGFEAADAERVSVRWLATAEAMTGIDAGAGRIQKGYDSLTSWLFQGDPAAKLDIRLNRVVRTVRWQPGRVEIEAIAGDRMETYQSRCAVVTLPIGVLQAPPDSDGAVELDPEIPGKRRVWEELCMGPVVKLALHFRADKWRRLGYPDHAFLHTQSSPFQAWWPQPMLSDPVLVGWSGGAAARQLAGLPPRKILEIGFHDLRRSFPMLEKDPEKSLSRWEVFDWQVDPYSRGAYCYVPVGGMGLPDELAQPVADTLFFAGEATHPHWTGTVEGAIASGFRAAREVSAALRDLPE